MLSRTPTALRVRQVKKKQNKKPPNSTESLLKLQETSSFSAKNKGSYKVLVITCSVLQLKESVHKTAAWQLQAVLDL